MMMWKRFVGIDFSASKQAGKLTAISVLDSSKDAALRLSQQENVNAFTGKRLAKEETMAALRDFVRMQTDALIALDAPLGLPLALMQGHCSWEVWLSDFVASSKSPEVFRAFCSQQAGGKELKRSCDREAKTPFSPYNLRIYRQTYYALTGLVGPLVLNQELRVLPMQTQQEGISTLIEACPASFLKSRCLYPSYKGKDLSHRQHRKQILDYLLNTFKVCLEPEHQEAMLQDKGGDLLDSLICALSAYQAAQHPGDFEETPPYTLEGQVYYGQAI